MLQSILIGPESRRAQPNLTHPPAAFPTYLPRGSAAVPANHQRARRPSSAWSRPRGSAYPIRPLAEPSLACRGRARAGRAAGVGGRGGLGAVGWSVVAAERSGKVSLEVKTAAELGALRGGGGAGVQGPERGPSWAGGLRTRASWGGGDCPTKDPWGARPRRPPRPRFRPPQAPRTRLSGAPQPGPAVTGLGGPHSATRLRSRCGREWPCLTVPSSPARPPRECDIPSPQPTRSCSLAPTSSRWSSSTPAPQGLDFPDLGQALPLGPPRASPSNLRAPVPFRGPLLASPSALARTPDPDLL